MHQDRYRFEASNIYLLSYQCVLETEMQLRLLDGPYRSLVSRTIPPRLQGWKLLYKRQFLRMQLLLFNLLWIVLFNVAVLLNVFHLHLTAMCRASVQHPSITQYVDLCFANEKFVFVLFSLVFWFEIFWVRILNLQKINPFSFILINE